MILLTFFPHVQSLAKSLQIVYEEENIAAVVKLISLIQHAYVLKDFTIILYLLYIKYSKCKANVVFWLSIIQTILSGFLVTEEKKYASYEM